MRKILLLIVAIFLLAGYEGYLIFQQPTGFGTKVVEIPARTSVPAIGYLLEHEGVLQHGWSLRIVAKISGKARKIQAGEFTFNIPSSPQNALNTLLYAMPVQHEVTVPEGSTVADMAPWFENSQIISAEEFLAASRDPSILQKFRIPADRIEGYLFPNTYHFLKHEKVEVIFQKMYDELQKNLDPTDRQKAAAYGWNLHQWLTFASVVEKETGNPNEYAIVSSVFHNRLIKGMRLQSDPTVIYGIENYDGNIHKKDLLNDTPYNTYTRNGLPIGPVANPGKVAIHFAVNPADTKYLYFVADPATKVHVFNEHYEDHAKAVRKYQLHLPDEVALPNKNSIVTKTKK